MNYYRARAEEMVRGISYVILKGRSGSVGFVKGGRESLLYLFVVCDGRGGEL